MIILYRKDNGLSSLILKNPVREGVVKEMWGNKIYMLKSVCERVVYPLISDSETKEAEFWDRTCGPSKTIAKS